MWYQTKNLELPNRQQVSALAISRDGLCLVAGDKAGCVHLFDCESEEWMGHREHRWAVVDVAISGDNAAVASVAKGQKRARGKSELASWCLDTEQVVVRPNRPGMTYRCPRFLNGSSQFAVKCGEIGIYDPVTGGNGQVIPEQTTGDVFAIAPDGNQLAFAARTGRIHVWPLAEWDDHPVAKLVSGFAEVEQLTFSGDGSLLLCLDEAGILRIYDFTAGELRTEAESPFLDTVACGWIPSLDGWAVVDDSSEVWRITGIGETQPLVERLLRHSVSVAAVCSATDRLAIAVGSRIRLFEIPSISDKA